MERTAAVGVSALGGGDGSELGSGFDMPDTPVTAVSSLALCPSFIVSSMAVDVESFRGRPLLRFGERVGFCSSLGEVG